MAEQTPLFMDINNVYSGDELGLPYRDIMGEGIVAATDLAVTASTGNTVDIAKGACWVLGDTNTDLQPCYRGYNDATKNMGITPDPTNPRYVRVVAQINDAAFSGAIRNLTITTIHGTPAGAPAVPALPASALDLATILVPAAAASSAAYTITDTRGRAKVGGGQAVGGGQVLLWDSVDAAVALPIATITTAALSSAYKHLVVMFVCQNSSGNQLLNMRCNGASTASYHVEGLFGVGAVASAAIAVGATSFALGSSGSAEPLAGRIDIYSYKDTTLNAHNLMAQAFCQNDGSGSMKTYWQGCLFNVAGAISTLSFTHTAGNHVAGSRISVYGLA